MVQLVQCLPCRHEDLSLNPHTLSARTCEEKGEVETRRFPRACWLMSIPNQQAPGLVRDLVLKIWGRECQVVVAYAFDPSTWQRQENI